MKEPARLKTPREGSTKKTKERGKRKEEETHSNSRNEVASHKRLQDIRSRAFKACFLSSTRTISISCDKKHGS